MQRVADQSSVMSRPWYHRVHIEVLRKLAVFWIGVNKTLVINVKVKCVKPLHPRVAHLRILPSEDRTRHEFFVPPPLPVRKYFQERGIWAKSSLHVFVDKVLPFREGLRIECPRRARPGLVPGRQNGIFDNLFLLNIDS